MPLLTDRSALLWRRLLRRTKAHRLPGRAGAKAAAEFWQHASSQGAGRKPPPRRPLDTFFPFDPYLLKQSAAFLDLARTYLLWVPRDDEEDEPDTTQSTPTTASALADKVANSVGDHAGGSFQHQGDSFSGKRARGGAGFGPQSFGAMARAAASAHSFGSIRPCCMGALVWIEAAWLSYH